MTFFVQKDCVDIIFKVQRGVYLTVSVYSLSNGRLLLACNWGDFWNRLRQMCNPNDVLNRLKKSCPLTAKIFINKVSPHFAYIDNEQKQGAVVWEMKAPAQSNSISDYLHVKVIEKAMELMMYNLNLYCELEKNVLFLLGR